MRRVVASEYVSVDGVFEEPGEWSRPFFSDDAARFKLDELFASDALLLGRLTYAGFAAAWPKMGPDEHGFAGRMNGIPKYVVSTTLQNPEWNNSTVIKGDVVEEVAKLKQAPGQDILIGGSGQLVRALMKHGLVDEIRFMVHPIVLGHGKRLFPEGSDRTVLKLVDTKTLSSGVTVLTYAPSLQP